MQRVPVATIVLGLCLLAGFPVMLAAVPPDADCAKAPNPDHPVPPGGPPACDPLLCDVAVSPPLGAIRVGDPFGSPTAEQLHFLFDEVGNRFHTRLFSQLRNSGGENVPSGALTVKFSVKANAIDVNDTVGGFVDLPDKYLLDVQPSVGPFNGYFVPASVHQQQDPVCWVLTPGALFPRKFLLKIETQWGLDEVLSNNVRYRFYDFGAQEPPADIALAIDLSGSMSAPVAGGGTRLSKAKDRAWMFIQAVEPGLGNRLGLFGFATGMPGTLKSDFTTSWTPPSGLPPPPTTLSDTAQLFPMTEMANGFSQLGAGLALYAGQVKPYGCTPIGQGLLRAKKALLSLVTPPGDDPHHKAIVLFSDGLQNVSPFVKEAPPWSCGVSPSLPLIDALKTFKLNNPTLPIYSIFFGTEGAGIWNHQLMVHIQEQTGGNYFYYTVSDLELAAAYFQIRHLVASNALLFLEEEGSVSAGAPTAPVTVDFDAAADVATVAVAWPVEALRTLLAVDGRRQGEGDDAWVELDELPQPPDDGGEIGTPTGTPAPAGAHRVYRFIPGPSTTWELRVRQAAPQGGSTSYAMAVFAPSAEARMRATLGAPSFVAGDALPVFADLRYLGHPIAGADVRALVSVPVRASSNVLRRYAGQLDPGAAPGDQTVVNLAAQLHKLVAADEGSETITASRQVTVTLRDDGGAGDAAAGDGIYSGRLSSAETTVAGLYELVVTASGALPSGAAFERREKLSAAAAVGPADPERSEVRFGNPVRLDNGNFAVAVTVLAADRFGNATYPGAAGVTVTPTPGGGAAVGGTGDNLDTTHTQRVEVVPGQKPSVVVSIDGVDLGTFTPGPTSGPAVGLEWSLHLGAVTPHGRFGRAVSGGPSFAIDLAYRFSRRFAVRTELALNRFDAPFGGDLDLVHLVPYLQVARPGTPWEPYFEAGLGVYDLESAGTAAGFAIGAGVHRDLASRWRLDIAAHTHHAGGGLDLSYSQLAFGILYSP